jgi:rhodanese-related sulfurtransferase
MNTARKRSESMIGAKLYPAFKEALVIFLIAFIAAVGVNLLRPAGIPLLGFSSEKFIQDQKTNIPLITLRETYELYRNKKVVFVDARDPFSFEEGHIAGAINIYPDEVLLHLPELKAQLPFDGIVITYCDGPQCSLSKDTAYALIKQGIPTVKVLIDGWKVWTNAGYPVGQGNK